MRQAIDGSDGTYLRSIAASLRSPLNRTGTSAIAGRYTILISHCAAQDMDKDDKRAHWSKIYATKPVESVSWFQDYPATSVEMVVRSAAAPAQVIDVGAGASALVDNLIERGYQVGVLDIATEALEQVQARLGDRSRRVEWFVTDVTRFESPHPWNVWHDRAVFHFLTEATDRDSYRAVLDRSTRSGTSVIIATFGMGGPDQCSGLPTVRYSPESLSRELGENYRLVETAFESHETPSGGRQEFVFCRFVRQ
jgi:hypothetical protein